MDYAFLKGIAEKYNAEVIFECVLAQYTSFKIGGKCDVLVKVNCEELICEIYNECKIKAIPIYVIGKGSNLLISDNGIKGVVLILASDFSEITVRDDMIFCQAGALLSKICIEAREHSLAGFEFAYGIPGTAGGALYMNAGAYGGDINEVIHSCRYLDSDGKIKELKADKMELSYRHSIFTDTDRIILSLRLQLKHGDVYKISSKMEQIMKWRQEKQPLDYPSAGSTFKRPQGDYASRLIEACGLKGASVGGAEVSRKHSGFVINKGGASFDDVMGVIRTVKDEVYRQTGVMLECEVKILS